MSRFLVRYIAPAAVIDEWKKTPAERRKEAEEKMMQDWRSWMVDHAKLFADRRRCGQDLAYAAPNPWSETCCNDFPSTRTSPPRM